MVVTNRLSHNNCARLSHKARHDRPKGFSRHAWASTHWHPYLRHYRQLANTLANRPNLLITSVVLYMCCASGTAFEGLAGKLLVSLSGRRRRRGGAAAVRRLPHVFWRKRHHESEMHALHRPQAQVSKLSKARHSAELMAAARGGTTSHDRLLRLLPAAPPAGLSQRNIMHFCKRIHVLCAAGAAIDSDS